MLNTTLQVQCTLYWHLSFGMSCFSPQFAPVYFANSVMSNFVQIFSRILFRVSLFLISSIDLVPTCFSEMHFSCTFFIINML